MLFQTVVRLKVASPVKLMIVKSHPFFAVVSQSQISPFQGRID